MQTRIKLRACTRFVIIAMNRSYCKTIVLFQVFKCVLRFVAAKMLARAHTLRIRPNSYLQNFPNNYRTNFLFFTTFICAHQICAIATHQISSTIINSAVQVQRCFYFSFSFVRFLFSLSVCVYFCF